MFHSKVESVHKIKGKVMENMLNPVQRNIYRQKIRYFLKNINTIRFIIDDMEIKFKPLFY